ncbi:hypothetical protein A3Q56_04645 [Intoshia linei]|uniref:MYND-type domain-containing protein n=1 Tax=Intoshia linei TaxID=1819745 RepID=A0A177B179_9BILA|nr:hypothetical protein A3Q56_04645 [Intoshia linei]
MYNGIPKMSGKLDSIYENNLKENKIALNINRLENEIFHLWNACSNKLNLYLKKMEASAVVELAKILLFMEPVFQNMKKLFEDLRLKYTDYVKETDLMTKSITINKCQLSILPTVILTFVNPQPHKNNLDSTDLEKLKNLTSQMELYYWEKEKKLIQFYKLQYNDKNHCWNCGRQSSEYCGKCNVAKYCGIFCKTKNWAVHSEYCHTYERMNVIDLNLSNESILSQNCNNQVGNEDNVKKVSCQNGETNVNSDRKKILTVDDFLNKN